MQAGPSGSKKVVRLIPTFEKRKLAAERRVVVAEEQRQESKARKEAKKLEKKEKELKKKKKLHKSGKARARVAVEEGQQQIEVDSDAELDIEGEELSDPDDEDLWEDAPKRQKSDIVYKVDGSTTSRCQALYSIFGTLNRMNGYPNVSECVVSQYTGIPLDDNRNSDLRSDLYNNPGLTVTEEDGTMLVRKVAPMQVENKADLCDLFKNRIPNGQVTTKNGLSALGVCEKDLEGAYGGIERDIDGMISNGEIVSISDHSRAGLNVYFPGVRGVAASPALKDMWNSVKVPEEKDLRAELIRMKLRTKEEYELRDKRVKDRNEAELKRLEEKKKAEKEAKRTTNAPLQVEGITGVEEGAFEELFG